MPFHSSLLLDERPLIEEAAATEPALSWTCPFQSCDGAIRVWAGGQSNLNLPICGRCDSPIATTNGERESLLTIINRHLL